MATEEQQLKAELMNEMINDCHDFHDRNGEPWGWSDLGDFLIRRGWRKAGQND